MATTKDPLPEDIEALKTALIETRARLSGAEALIEHLRLVMGELMVATVRAQVTLSLVSDFENFTTFKPLRRREAELTTLFDQLVSWASALKAVRSPYAGTVKMSSE